MIALNEHVFSHKVSHPLPSQEVKPVLWKPVELYWRWTGWTGALLVLGFNQ